MKSMTGYGKGIFTENGKEVTVEIKTVNNRFLEISNRLPKSMQVMDELLRMLISKHIKRGSVDIYLNYVNTAEPQQTLTADIPLIESYIALAKEINARTGVENDLTMSALVRIPELIKAQQATQNVDIFKALVSQAATEALKNLDLMRQKEGKTIAADLKKLLNVFETVLGAVKERTPLILNEYRQKLKDRITEYLKQVEVDEARLINETAFFADKSDVNEELQRLDSHLVQFKEALKSKEPAGRKLDFITQEIGREVNTLGSKANDISLINGVVELKNVLEKIKEQIRNIE